MKGIVPFTARRASATHEDCRFWGLTPNECHEHHIRLGRYHVRRAHYWIGRAAHYRALEGKALTVALWAAAVCAASVLVIIVRAWMS